MPTFPSIEWFETIRNMVNSDEQYRRLGTVDAKAGVKVGDEIYELAQRRDDDAQEGLLTSLLTAEAGWELHVAHSGDEIVGFVSFRLNRQTLVGEIGLNAVDPARAGSGIGTAMYEFALRRMKEAGMKVATVGTGGDPSHAPARHAYRKVGFDAELPTVWMFKKL